MASIQNVLRTFTTTYELDVRFLNSAAESKGQKTHQIPLSLAAAGPVFYPNQLYQKILHIVELTCKNGCFITFLPILSEKEIKRAIGGVDLKNSLQWNMADY